MNQQIEKPYDDLENIPIAKLEGLMEHLKLLRVSPMMLHAYALSLDVEESNEEENKELIAEGEGVVLTIKDSFQAALECAIDDSRDEVYAIYSMVEDILIKRELMEPNES